MSILKFSGNQSAFYEDLKTRVQAYFNEKKLKTHGDRRNLIKSLVLLSQFVACYVLLAFHILPGAWGFILIVILGFLTAGIGFNIMHDGAHGSLSGNPKINKLAALTLNMLGASSFLWNIKHNVIHHSFTNVDDHDDDILNEPFFRMAKSQPRYFYHRLQFLYFPVAYGLMYMAWIFMLDYKKYFGRSIGERKNIKWDLRHHFGFWITKVVYILVYVVIPLQFYSWPVFILGYFIYSFTTGLTISIVFQLAHTVEHTEFIDSDKNMTVLNTDWASHQVRTTSNFATRNPIITWFTGGLNFQVEHHLFPRISHVHYPALSLIVKDTCSRHGLPYLEQPTLGKAIASHVRFLYKLGRKEVS